MENTNKENNAPRLALLIENGKSTQPEPGTVPDNGNSNFEPTNKDGNKTNKSNPDDTAEQPGPSKQSLTDGPPDSNRASQSGTGNEPPSTSQTNSSRGGERGTTDQNRILNCGGTRDGAPNSNIQTLQPYIHGDRNTGRTRQRKKTQIEMRRLWSETRRQNEEPFYDRFFIIKFPGLNIEEDIPVITTDETIRQRVGERDDRKIKISMLNKDSLLVEVSSEEQGRAILKIGKIANRTTTVEKHSTMNQVMGTAISRALIDETREKSRKP